MHPIPQLGIELPALDKYYFRSQYLMNQKGSLQSEKGSIFLLQFSIGYNFSIFNLDIKNMLTGPKTGKKFNSALLTLTQAKISIS